MLSTSLRIRSGPAVALVLFCLCVGLPATVALTPGQDLVAFGQQISVGARTPDLSVSGPAQVVQVGNTAFDVERLRVWGPLRPQLTLGPVQRNAAAQAVLDPEAGPRLQRAAVDAVTGGFLAWYLTGAALLVAITLAASAGAAGLRTLLVLRSESRRPGGHRSLPEIWSHCVRGAGRMTAAAVVASVLAWGAAGGLAYAGAAGGLGDVASLSQLVGARHLATPPAGPVVTGFDGAVIGDSRVARLGGPPLPDGTPDDVACQRSTDSLAEQIAALRGDRVLNLACPSATVTAGLRGPQDEGGRTLEPQVGRLKQVQGLDWVVVAVGPNDVGWIDFLLYCYGVPDCSDNLTQGEFDYRLAAFDRVFGDLLVDLNDLPGRPRIIVLTSYDAFPVEGAPSDVPCPDSRGPEEYPGLDAEKIVLLDERNRAVNDILSAGAQAYGFAVARPVLRPLCGAARAGLGPDLQGLADPFPFHPTGVGSLRMAAAVIPLLDPPPPQGG
ncbi:hypothetical protein GCM10017691_28350 [Pseudonocardia petroleophila]|uniref:SGNH hydrolase-type esterase domain-containing protein n=1 Tax=Pseudonocardia petroleophila TaxID=37331 RepID=A0A7G7MES2_9PSEU|nr:GDSL-type esterase/lipase family protein [Pseudonocardia petroleophila]QNG51283.1 hypothetical protein H6H00_24520 [Pseudonocardia petroleophila]